MVIFLPIKDTCMQTWQEPIVRELDDNGEWVDVLGRCFITQLKGGEKVGATFLHSVHYDLIS